MRYSKIYAIKFFQKVIYIGQTTDALDSRFWKHIQCLKGTGGSRIPKLYEHMAANSKNGELPLGYDGYSFELIEVVEKTDLYDREKFWISKFRTQEKCNTTAGGVTARGSDHYLSARVRCLRTGTVFGSMGEAARARGCSTATVCLHVNGKRLSPLFERA